MRETPCAETYWENSVRNTSGQITSPHRRRGGQRTTPDPNEQRPALPPAPPGKTRSAGAKMLAAMRANPADAERALVAARQHAGDLLYALIVPMRDFERELAEMARREEVER